MSAESKMINGYVYDHGDLTLKFDGKQIDDVQEVKYSTKREIGKFRGTSPLARGRTRGTLDFEGSMVMLRSTLDVLIAEWGDGWMEKEFTVTATFGNDGQPLVTDTLVGCTILSDEISSAEGADPNLVSVGLDIKGILRNGKAPMKGMKF
jgi:hypothetical protein